MVYNQGVVAENVRPADAMQAPTPSKMLYIVAKEAKDLKNVQVTFVKAVDQGGEAFGTTFLEVCVGCLQ